MRTPGAQPDVIDIDKAARRNTPPAADPMLDRIDAAIDGLADVPRSGRARPGLGLGLGRWLLVVHPCVVVYRRVASRAAIGRLLHAARDLPNVVRRK